MVLGHESVDLPPAPDFSLEARLWNLGFPYVAGIDEAGRGALAGPVAVGVIIFPADPKLHTNLSGVNDSKVMSPAQREYWAERIQASALDSQVGYAQVEEIDQLGILPAVHLAARRALAALNVTPGILITDYLELTECPLPHVSLVKGDARSLSVAAASILAKTARDALLSDLGTRYPGYGFEQHKGYGTAAHCAALKRLGPSRVHRLSFQPVSDLVSAEG